VYCYEQATPCFWLAEKNVEGQTNVRDETVEYPSDVEQLTVFKENEMLRQIDEGRPDAQFWKQKNPFEVIEQEQVLGRVYDIDTITWNAQATGSVLGTYYFPDDLFAIPQVASKLEWFRFFRAKGVKIGVRMNSTAFHYGRIAISYTVGE
jgi:hypothetical protein